MKIVLLDLSRNVASPEKVLQGSYPEAEITHASKASWKRLGARALFREVRSLDADVFAIAIDDLDTAQDLLLFELLAVVSSAGSICIVEVATSRLHTIGRVRFVAVTIPRMFIGMCMGILCAAAFLALLLVVSFASRLRRRRIIEGYQVPAEFDRVAYLRTDLAFNLKAGGSITHTRGVIRGFQSNGKQVLILSNEKSPWLEIPGAPLKVLRRTRWCSFWRESERMINGVWFAIQAIRQLRSYNPQILYQRKCLLDISGVLVSLWLRVPLVIEANDCTGAALYWERFRFKKLASLAEKVQFSAATMGVSISEAVYEQLGQQGYDVQRIRVIFNGVELESFATEDAERSGVALRRDIGILPGETVIGFVGTFGQWHGIHTLSAGMLEILGRVGNLRFLLVGDGEMRVTCENAVQKAGFADRVCFTGLVPSGQIPAYLAACDILVSPHSKSPDGTKFIGSPTKLFEYMAANRSIVASRLDQIGEVLDDGRTALLFEPDDVAGFVDALNRAAADSRLRNELGRNARAEVGARFTWHANVGHILKFIGQVAAARG